MKHVIGIDTGAKGGIGVINLNTKGLTVFPIPLDDDKDIDFNKIMTDLSVICNDGCKVYLEHSQAIPGSFSTTSAFRFGQYFGELRVFFTFFSKDNLELVKPRVWQRDFHSGLDPHLTSKERSLIAVFKLFPYHDFLATPRSRKPHDGMIDAALIAEWGRRQIEKEKQWQVDELT